MQYVGFSDWLSSPAPASPTLCPFVGLQNSPISFSRQCPLHIPQDQNPLKALAGPWGKPPLPMGLSFLLCEVESQKRVCKLGSRVLIVSVGFVVGQRTHLPCPFHQVMAQHTQARWSQSLGAGWL